MALYRFRLKHYQVSKGGAGHASRMVRYLQREGEYAPQVAQVDYLTRQSRQTRDRTDLRHVETQHLPAWAPDAATFFAAAQQYERRNGRWGTMLEIALPRELDRAQQLALARDFLGTHLANKPTLWVLHEPQAKDGGLQPHIHVLFSERGLDGIERSPEQFFRRYNPQHPEQGGAQKDPFLNQRRAVGRLREAWAAHVNYALERGGLEARIDPRSLRARGLAHEGLAPETKAGLAQTQAQAWWAARKQQYALPSVCEITPAAFQAQVAVQTQAGHPGQAWSLPTAAAVQALEARIQALEAYGQRLEAAQGWVQERTQGGKLLRPTEEVQLERLLGQGQALGVVGEREVIYQGAQVERQERRRAHGYGYGHA